MTKKFFTVALCCMYVANHAWCQNPILRSSTTGIPSLSGTTGSIITQKGDHIGIGTTDPTKRLTLRYTTGSVASSGVGIMSTLPIPATIRYEYYDSFSGWTYWDLSGSESFNLTTPSNSSALLSVGKTHGVSLLGFVYAKVPNSTGNNYLRMEAEANSRVISWGSYALSGGNNTNVPFEFIYKAHGTGGGDIPIMKLMPSGNVGIGTGTGSPTERLHVANGNLKVSNGQLILDGTSADKLVISGGNIKITGGRLILENPTGLGSGPTRIALNSDGTIRAREIVVDLQTIPDYVFDETYPLMPIAELKNYINQNKHLPGLPSEAEYAERGDIKLTELNLKLLEKVEELSLYIISLKDELDALKAEVKTNQK